MCITTTSILILVTLLYAVPPYYLLFVFEFSFSSASASLIVISHTHNFNHVLRLKSRTSQHNISLQLTMYYHIIIIILYIIILLRFYLFLVWCLIFWKGELKESRLKIYALSYNIWYEANAEHFPFFDCDASLHMHLSITCVWNAVKKIIKSQSRKHR